MTSAAAVASRFIRRTSLGEGEYRVNFKQIDCDVLDTLASDEACAVTPSLSKIYIRLIRAPLSYWEREGVLRFVGEERGGEPLTAWEQLIQLTGVANSTLSKALTWMHDSGIIGYDARKNGVGIRIFINRARSSIRSRGQKNLRLVPAPSDSSPTPSDGIPFKEHVLRKDLDKDINPPARIRAGETPVVAAVSSLANAQRSPSTQYTSPAVIAPSVQLDLSQVVGMVKLELKPVITSICDDAIASACRKEAALNREWFEKTGIPKAVRVAQREAFDILRSHGVIPRHAPNSANVGSNCVASKAGKEVGSEMSKIVVFLAETLDMVRQVAADDAVSEKPVMQAAFRAVERELRDLHSQIALDDGGMPVDIEGIENRLAAVEDVIMGALWQSTDPDEVGSMMEAAAVKLKRYERTMEAGMYKDTLQRYVMARLGERHGIPRLSLFYL